MGFSTSPHGGKYTKAEVLVGTANEKINAAIEDRNAPKLADPNILQRNVNISKAAGQSETKRKNEQERTHKRKNRNA